MPFLYPLYHDQLRSAHFRQTRYHPDSVRRFSAASLFLAAPDQATTDQVGPLAQFSHLGAKLFIFFSRSRWLPAEMLQQIIVLSPVSASLSLQETVTAPGVTCQLLKG